MSSSSSSHHQRRHQQQQQQQQQPPTKRIVVAAAAAAAAGATADDDDPDDNDNGNDGLGVGAIVGGAGTHTRPWKVEDVRDLRTRRLTNEKNKTNDQAVTKYLHRKKTQMQNNAAAAVAGGGVVPVVVPMVVPMVGNSRSSSASSTAVAAAAASTTSGRRGGLPPTGGRATSHGSSSSSSFRGTNYSQQQYQQTIQHPHLTASHASMPYTTTTTTTSSPPPVKDSSSSSSPSAALEYRPRTIMARTSSLPRGHLNEQGSVVPVNPPYHPQNPPPPSSSRSSSGGGIRIKIGAAAAAVSTSSSSSASVGHYRGGGSGSSAREKPPMQYAGGRSSSTGTTTAHHYHHIPKRRSPTNHHDDHAAAAPNVYYSPSSSSSSWAGDRVHPRRSPTATNTNNIGQVDLGVGVGNGAGGGAGQEEEKEDYVQEAQQRHGRRLSYSDRILLNAETLPARPPPIIDNVRAAKYREALRNNNASSTKNNSFRSHSTGRSLDAEPSSPDHQRRTSTTIPPHTFQRQHSTGHQQDADRPRDSTPPASNRRHNNGDNNSSNNNSNNRSIVDLDESFHSQGSVNDKIAAFEQKMLLSSPSTSPRSRATTRPRTSHPNNNDNELSSSSPLKLLSPLASPSSSGNSPVVDQYLAQRQRLKDNNNNNNGKATTTTTSPSSSPPKKAVVGVSRVISSLSSAATSSSPPLKAPMVVASSVSTDESSFDDDEDDDESDAGYNDDTDETNTMAGGGRATKSIKVCVISAIDVPASVVPNLPFCPYLRLSVGDDHGGSSSRCRRTSSKILSKRDNGAVEFHEEVRFDNVPVTARTLTLELASRTVMAPANQKESPAPHVHQQPPTAAPHLNNLLVTPHSNKPITAATHAAVSSAELQQAQAAAAVAQLLVAGEAAAATPSHHNNTNHHNTNEWYVQLRKRKRKRPTTALVIGRTEISLAHLMDQANGSATARLEQWVSLDDDYTSKLGTTTTTTAVSPPAITAAATATTSPNQNNHGLSGRRNPSVLLEISVSTREQLDESENDMEGTNASCSYSKRASAKIRKQLQQEFKPDEESVEEPMLEPGIIDYICIVGARDIGDQKADDGSRGWVTSQPECVVLEQFPPDDFHAKNGRSAVLPGKVEWFCFPEGCRLWRGLTPPNPDELNLKRFSASSPSTVSAAVASFDACLSCTSSFSWFVVSSNSEEYGSETRKTYGAVIRFFVPAPTGVDPTQDDFGQVGTTKDGSIETKRLWVPIGICMTSRLPIVGTMEVLLLRLCESLSPNGVFASAESTPTRRQTFQAVASLIVNCQRPLPGIVNCSFSFLHGDRLHISLPSPKGLPSLPHGSCVTSVCRLLGADGLNYVFAAFLSECKILLHSDEIANLCMVAEVMTALLYPFQWSLPYIPVLPLEMMEIIEAPVSFLLGIPSCNLDLVDPNALEDIVVVDLDKDFNGSDFFGAMRVGVKSKVPPPLPAAVASNISKAVYTLLRAQDEIEKVASAPTFSGERSFPRTEAETSAEREFRVSVAMEVCSLIQGFDDCLVFSSSQPVFNVDRFLQMAPSIFEEPRAAGSAASAPAAHQPFRKVVSARSRRFVSTLVCCQHFHQFLEMLDSDSLSMFHALMRSVTTRSSQKSAGLGGKLLSLDPTRSIDELCLFLQNIEDKTPTFRVNHYSPRWKALVDAAMSESAGSNFPLDVLHPIKASNGNSSQCSDDQGVKSISMEFLVELEKNPWRYSNLFHLDSTSLFGSDGSCKFPAIEKVSIREAIGARRYRAWKSSAFFDGEDSTLFSEDSRPPTHLDLTSLLSSVAMEDLASMSNDNTTDKPASNDRDVVRRCLESVRVASGQGEKSVARKDFGLVEEAEEALKRSRVAQRFVLDVLNERLKKQTEESSLTTPGRKRNQYTSGSKVDWGAFEVLLRLSFAMLEAFDDNGQYDSACNLLKLTAGIHSTSRESDNDVSIVYLTERIGLHPIYSNLSVWERVCTMHRGAQKNSNQQELKKQSTHADDKVEDNYEAVVATLYEMNGYGVPAEVLARFASRMCETHGWYNTEKGQTLLMLAKRAASRRDQVVAASTPSRISDLELMSPSGHRRSSMATRSSPPVGAVVSRQSDEDSELWNEISWCHPAAQSARRQGKNADGNKRGVSQNIVQKLDNDGKTATTSEGEKYMKRAAVTALAYLGSSVVVTGGLDGGVFMARRIKRNRSHNGQQQQDEIRGVHLDWGSSGSRYSVGSASTSLDGEYGVGAVTCVVATRNNLDSVSSSSSRRKDTMEPMEDEELLNAMDGCRVVAGTTCGDLRVWSIKDVYSAVFYSARGGDLDSFSPELPTQRHAAGTKSSFLTERRKKATDFAAGSSLTRLKFSLRGRALSGHRGGVACISLHSNLYKPDSVVTGGADGLIKLWSLRTPGSSGSRRASFDTTATSLLSSPSREKFGVSGKSGSGSSSRTGDALSILTGHGGRVLCVNTAWHGDRLLSGGADRTVRLWDLASGNGKCLHSLSGHFGWVTAVKFWGPNTLISASTDRSIALWDARVSSAPLFVLRHHNAPISDMLISPRSSDPVMISAAVDGSVASWDFRELSGRTTSVSALSPTSGKSRPCQVVRSPASVAPSLSKRKLLLGPVLLSKGVLENKRTILYTGADSVLREWDYQRGQVVSEHATGHCDSISNLLSLRNGKVLDNQLENTTGGGGGGGNDYAGGTSLSTITASNDGTIRLRTMMQK